MDVCLVEDITSEGEGEVVTVTVVKLYSCDSGENYAFPRIGHFSHARVSNISSAFKSAVVK